MKRGQTTNPLTDEDLLRIATAPPDLGGVELARQIGKEYFTVAAARRRLKLAGGWFSNLRWTTCLVCEQPLAHGPIRRSSHPQCRRARAAWRQRESRKRKPGQSTPYVALWRQQHPEQNRNLREKDKARMRDQYHNLSPDEKTPILAKLHRADQRDYPITLEHVDHAGEPWTEDEDRFVLDHPTMPARDVALEMGRTLWAVRGRRVRLRRQITAHRVSNT